MTVVLPESLEYGFVTGRYIVAVADGADPDRLPEAKGATGLTITFTPQVTMHKIGGEEPTTVLRVPQSASVGPDGRIYETGQDAPGLWLVTGVYNVTFGGSYPGARLPSNLAIEVLPTHTESNPLRLPSAEPYVPPAGATVQLVPLPPGGSPGQYLTPLTDGGHGWADAPSGDDGTGGTPDHALLTNRDAADQHPIGAISGLEDALADLSDVVRTDDPRLSDPRPPTEHNHDGIYVKPADLPAPQTWDTLPDKPPVIAAGTSATAARDAIGAGTSNLQLGTGSTTAAAGNHTHDDRYYTETEADGRFVRTVNGTAPDGSGNVVVSGGGGGGAALPQFGKAQLAPQVFGSIATLPVNPLIPAGATVSARYPVGASPVALPAVTLDIIAVAVTTAGAAGALIRFGIYGTTATGAPGTLLWDSGDIAADTTGRKQIEIPAGLALPAGDYWTVCVSNDPAVRALCWDPLAAARVSASDMMGGSNRRLTNNAATGAALPATLTLISNNSSSGDSAVLFGRVKA